MKETNYKRYEGESLKEPVKDIAAYFPSKELQDAIEYARILQRPLLLRGEPGCGKTKVAQALAFEIYHGNTGHDYSNHYFEWHIKSTTKAKEGLYSFDHLQRLRDVQAKEEKDKTQYRTFGAVGKAFQVSKRDAPAVLLIDEIDKANLDFPNDLLLELDEKRFFIEETGEEIKAEYPPIVIITSNDEKELPNAFLRRCVFHYIDFPNQDELLKIAKSKITAEANGRANILPEPIIQEAVQRFYDLYQTMKANPNTDKVPSTSELLDWLRVLQYYHIEGKLPLVDGKLPTDHLLYPEVILKSLDDFKQQAKDK